MYNRSPRARKLAAVSPSYIVVVVVIGIIAQKPFAGVCVCLCIYKYSPCLGAIALCVIYVYSCATFFCRVCVLDIKLRRTLASFGGFTVYNNIIYVYSLMKLDYTRAREEIRFSRVTFRTRFHAR